jgi:hypothetical protein
MNKLPHGWYLLCDNGAAEVAGEIAEYLFCWGLNSTAALQSRYAVDHMLHQFIAGAQGQRTAINALMQNYQVPANWLAGVCNIYTAPPAGSQP